VLVAADSSIGDPIRELASECGVEFDEVLNLELVTVSCFCNFGIAEKCNSLTCASGILSLLFMGTPNNQNPCYLTRNCQKQISSYAVNLKTSTCDSITKN